jgi:hypothetical protein
MSTEEIIYKRLIDEMCSHRHALALNDKNMRELIALLKDKKFRERERGY